MKKIIHVLLTVFLGMSTLLRGYAEENKMVAQTEQGKVVHGRVIDKDGTPLPGVNVTIKGITKGVFTNSNGDYSLEVPGKDDILIFSFIGFTTQEISIGSSTVIDVVLQEEINKLEEVVIIGYGTQRKKDVTGSISQVSSTNLLQASTSTFDQMLQGKVAGVQITQTTGAPGGNVNVLIRGVSSITGGNQPLYVVDGFPFSMSDGTSDMFNFGDATFSSSGMASNAQTSSRINPLSSINPSDIESIEILKDASATAIYGSRGANGVIIITTKHGIAGKSQINVDISYGFQDIEHKLKLMNSQEYIAYVVEARNNAWIRLGGLATDPNSVRNQGQRIPPGFENPSSITTNTDWQDAIFRVAPVQNYQVSGSGGNDKIKYFITGGYFNQEGIILTSDYRRFNIRSNIDAQILKRLKVGSTISASYGYGSYPNTEGHYGSADVLSMAQCASPTIPVKDSNGNPYFNADDVTYGLGWLVNPLTVLNTANYSDQRDQTNLIFNNFLEYKIMEGLTFKSTIGIKYDAGTTKLWRSSELPWSTTPNYPATGGASKNNNIDWLNENTVNFKHLFKDKHFFEVLLGLSEEKNSFNVLSAGATSFPTNYVPYITAGTVNTGSQYLSEWSMVSLISRLNYTYEGKYLFTATLRRDGCSRFGINNQWGTFPSVSVGYNMAEESFIKSLNYINNLKLRASYGISGNNQIGNYTMIGLLSSSNYVNGSNVVPGLVPSSMSNNDLTWEKSKQVDFGLDLGLFDNRISVTADIYQNLKTDLLLNVELPAISGYSSATENVGDIENKGFELGLQTINIKSMNFTWSSNFNFSTNKNKVKRLSSGGSMIIHNDEQVTEVGYPIASFYLIPQIGIFQNAQEVASSALQDPGVKPGDIKFEDVDGDGKITANDRKIVGNPWPDFTWGFNNTFSYKNISLSVIINASHGADTYLYAGTTILNSAGVQNQLADFHRWESENDPGDGRTPRAIRSNYAFSFSDNTSHFLFDASYVRIKGITLSYSIPHSILSKLSLSNLNVYFDVANVYTFTHYPGYEPDLSSTGNNITSSGIDWLTFPLARTYTIGLKLSF